MTPSSSQPERRTIRTWLWRLAPLLLVVGAGIALVIYGFTPTTTVVAALGMAAAAWTGYRARRPSDPPAAVRDGVARRAVLTGAALTAAGAAGSVLQARSRHEPSVAGSADEVSLLDHVGMVVDRPDRSDQTTWDWTPALRAALDTAARRARSTSRVTGTSAYRRTGLPTVTIPRGTYRLTGQIDLTYLHGLTIAGAGRQSSVLVFEGSGVLFEVHRSSALTFSGLTISGHDPSVPADDDVQGLREGSCAFRFAERTDDSGQGGGNTYMATFSGLEVNEMHRAFAFSGDQMTDGIIWNDLRLRDNFYDFDYANGNTVNHQVFGCEVLCGVSFPEQSYMRRLRTWVASPDLRDGAVINVSTGGDLSYFGGSIIVRKATIAFASPPQDASQGAVSNVAGYNFFATRWEFRDRDAGEGEDGLQRSTLIRWRVPGPMNRNVQPTLRFDACRFIVLVDDVDLLYLANAAAITWDGCRVFPPRRGRVVSLVNSSTATMPGAFLAEGSSLLPVVRRLLSDAGPAVDHLIEMSPRSAPDIGQTGGSPDGYASVIAGRSNTIRRILFRNPSGNLLESRQASLTIDLRVHPGGLLRQVGAVLLDPGPQQVSVSFEADGLTIGELVARAGNSKPSASVEEFTASGLVQATVSRDDVAPVRGYVYVEYF